MLIVPAIDIKNGKCVRLTRGDFNKEKVYADDPVTIAKQWEAQGAKMLHVVDLDGAKDGNPVNLEVIKKIAKSISIPIQLGGGIRSKEIVENVLAIGVANVVLGTVALENEDELKKILINFAKQIIVALDTKNGKLMKKGWVEVSDKKILDSALALQKMGVQKFLFTDVLRDGTLTEPNFQILEN